MTDLVSLLRKLVDASAPRQLTFLGDVHLECAACGCEWRASQQDPNDEYLHHAEDCAWVEGEQLVKRLTSEVDEVRRALGFHRKADETPVQTILRLRRDYLDT